MNMKTHFLLLCGIASSAMLAQAATHSKISPEKPSEIRLVSGKWSDESLFNMGDLLDEGFELQETSWHWSETRGGKYSDYFKNYHTNSSDTYIREIKGHIEPDRSIPLEHVDISGVNTVATNYNVTNVTFPSQMGWQREVPQEQGALKSPIRQYGNWEKRSSKVNVVLRTGGRGQVKAQNVFAITGAATEMVLRPNPTVGWGAIIVDATNDVPFNQIRVPGLKKNLGLDGKAWATLPDNSEIKMTLEAGRPLYHFEVSHEKFVFARQTEHTALTDTNRLRTKLGVGEEVDLGFNPDPASQTNVNWTVSGGGFGASTWTHWATNLQYSGITFTAPSNAASKVKLKVTVADAKPLEFVFKVVEPSAYDQKHTYVESTNGYGPGVAGAEMHLQVAIKPLDVSFYKVFLAEIGTPGEDVTDYFTNFPPAALFHSTTGIFVQLTPTNTLPYGDECSLGPLTNSFPWPWPGSTAKSGRFKWNVPVMWRVGLSSTNEMTGWEQEFSITEGGTVTIKKFGHQVERGTNDVITAN